MKQQTHAQFLAEFAAFEVPALLTDSHGRDFPAPPELWEVVHGGSTPKLRTLTQPRIDELARRHFKC